MKNNDREYFKTIEYNEQLVQVINYNRYNEKITEIEERLNKTNNKLEIAQAEDFQELWDDKQYYEALREVVNQEYEELNL